MPPKRFPKREPAVRKPPAVARHDLSNSSSEPSVTDGSEQNETYEEELAWCIHRLKLSLNTKKLNPKQVENIKKDVGILENPNESVVRKRCIMNLNLGNYRQKMDSEKQKLQLQLHNAAINVSSSNTGQFMRKSHSADPQNKSVQKFIFQPSDNNFKFNFNTDCE